jgi:outer membrane protein assembly factor BamB
VNTQTDASNCGACGTACGLYGACSGGACTLACPTGLTACGAVCVDLTSTQLHCGSCSNACPSGQLCAASACVVPPPSVWQTVGSDGQHSGHNPNETGRPPLALLWSQLIGTGTLWPVVYDGGTLFAMKGSTLYALDPASGTAKWSRALQSGGPGGVGMPTAASGKVFAGMSGNGGDTFLYVVDQVTGTLTQTFPFASQWETYWAPLVVGTKVYFDGGTYGGMYGYDTATASQTFFVSLDQYDSWSPAIFGGKLYTFIDGNFRSHDPGTGAVQGTLAIPWTWTGYSMRTAPVFGSTYAYIVTPPSLYAVNPATMATVWSDGAGYTSMAAVANGVVFGVGNANLRALDAGTGKLLWTFAGDGALSYPPVVANGYVYVASSANTYAVDLTTHQQVWTAAKGGWLAVAGGDLFIAGSDGAVSAYNLSQ